MPRDIKTGIYSIDVKANRGVSETNMDDYIAENAMLRDKLKDAEDKFAALCADFAEAQGLLTEVLAVDVNLMRRISHHLSGNGDRNDRP